MQASWQAALSTGLDLVVGGDEQVAQGDVAVNDRRRARVQVQQTGRRARHHAQQTRHPCLK